MRDKPKYHNNSQAALIKVMEALSADTFPELSLAELVSRTALPKDAVFRTLYMLQEAGWITKPPLGERYCLSRDWAQIGYRYLEHMRQKRDQQHREIQEFRD